MLYFFLTALPTACESQFPYQHQYRGLPAIEQFPSCAQPPQHIGRRPGGQAKPTILSLILFRLVMRHPTLPTILPSCSEYPARRRTLYCVWVFQGCRYYSCRCNGFADLVSLLIRAELCPATGEIIGESRGSCCSMGILGISEEGGRSVKCGYHDTR